MQLNVVELRYMSGRCAVIDRCPEMQRLRDSEERGMTSKTLAAQYHDLCSVGGYCLLREELTRGEER